MSDLVFRFAQNLGQSRPLTEIGSNIGQIMQLQAAKRQQEAAQNHYRTALDIYMQNQSPENLMAFYEAGKGVGMSFDDAQNQVGAYTSAQAQQEVETYGSGLYAPLVTGNYDMAMQNVGALMEAAIAEGDREEAQELQQIKALIEDGSPEAIQRATGLIGIGLGQTEEGRAFLQADYDRRTSNVDEAQGYASAINQMIDTQIESPERREELRETALKMANPSLAEMVVDMATVAQGIQGGDSLTIPQISGMRLAWRNQYNDELKRFTEINTQAATARTAGLRALGMEYLGDEFGEAQGAADLALVNAFQRLIDPATVREQDIRNLRTTIGGVEAMKLMFEGFTEGDKLTPTQRRALISISDQIREVYAEQEQVSREVIAQNIEDINRFSGMEDALTEESIMGSRLFVRDEESRQKEVKEALKGIYPNERNLIDNYTWEEILREYPRTLEGMGIGPDTDMGSVSATLTPESSLREFKASDLWQQLNLSEEEVQEIEGLTSEQLKELLEALLNE